MKGFIVKGTMTGLALLVATTAFAANTSLSELDKKIVKNKADSLSKERSIYSATGCMACHQNETTQADEPSRKTE